MLPFIFLLTVPIANALCAKLEKGEKHLEGVTEYLNTVEDSITSKRRNGDDLLGNWRVHEIEWKKKIVDISQHKEIDRNYPYELPAEAGTPNDLLLMSSRTHIESTALTPSQIHVTLAAKQVRNGDRSAFAVVNVIHELLSLDEDQYVCACVLYPNRRADVIADRPLRHGCSSSPAMRRNNVC